MNRLSYILFLFIIVCAGNLCAQPKVRIGVVLPTTKSDASWSQSLVVSLEKLQSRLQSFSLDISYKEEVQSKKQLISTVRSFALDNMDLIIAHDPSYVPIIKNMASSYPTANFAVGSVSKEEQDMVANLPNVYTYRVAYSEAGYVNGVIAALYQDFVTLGYVTPSEDTYPTAKEYRMGLENGMSEISSSSHLLLSYVRSPYNAKLSENIAGFFLLNDVQILTGFGPQSIGAFKVSSEGDIMWVGLAYDMEKNSPNTVLASQIFNWEGIFSSIIYLVKKNEPTPNRHFVLRYKNNGIQTKFNPNVYLPNTLKDTVDKVVEAIEKEYIDPLEKSSLRQEG